MKFNIKELRIPKIDKEKLVKVCRILVSHAFSIMLFLILVSIVWSALLFYYDVILVESKPEQVFGKTIEFEYGKYQDILKEWEAKQQKFQDFENQQNENPFTIAH